MDTPMKKNNQKNIITSGFALIPDEILLHIFSFTDLKTLSNLLLVSKRFNSVSQDELKKYYKSVSQEEFGEAFDNKDELKKYCEKLSQKEFGKAFAKSIFYYNVLLFSILKDIANSKDNDLKPDCDWAYNEESEKAKLEEIYDVGQFWGKSLLYFVIEQVSGELALDLIDGIKADSRYPLVKDKKTEAWTKKDVINLGYSTDDTCPDSVTPLTLAMKRSFYTTNAEELSIIYSLIELGGEIFVHERYYHLPDYTSQCEDLLPLLLQQERKYKEKFYLKNIASLQNKLDLAQQEIKQLKSGKRKREENKKESDSTKITKPTTPSIFSKKEADEHHKPAKPAKRPRHGN